MLPACPARFLAMRLAMGERYTPRRLPVNGFDCGCASLTAHQGSPSLPRGPSGPQEITVSSLITPAISAAIGKEGERRTVAIERGAIVRFTEAIADPNPAYPDLAPPTFLRSVGLAIPTLPGQDAVPRVLDGGSEWTYGAPVRPGDQVTFATSLESATEREGRMGAMLILTYATVYTNQRGEQVATQRNTVIRMGAQA
jgi:hypothetical protein